jgi:uncharacterized protein YdhG (YjbR/CyaY superfamily)
MPDTTKAAKKAPAKRSASAFSAEERAAMKEHAAEVKARRRGATPADDEAAVLEKIAGFADSDRVMAERIHAIVRASAPSLGCRLWYGMPAYTKDGKVLMHFQDAGKFKMRYATVGFSDEARLDDGSMWPNAFALKKLTKADEAKIADLVRRAVG